MRIRPAALAAILVFLAVPSRAAGPPATEPDARLPDGGRPAQRVPFPPIVDWASLRIVLQRSGCFGTCPIYSVEIAGDGRVLYNGERFVAVLGKHRRTIPPAEVRALYDSFRRADFFWLLDDYRAPIFDGPLYSVSLTYDGHSKTVIDYLGGAIGMPHDVIDLEDLIDKTANTQRWIVKHRPR